MDTEENQQIFDQESIIKEIKESELGEIIDAPEQSAIAGFWSRVFAFLIDGIILAIPMVIFGFATKEVLFLFGPWGRLISYPVIILYWGYFNSEKGRGQTPGKRIVKIVVVDENNNYLTFWKSLLRAFVLGIILVFNGWILPTALQNPVMLMLINAIIWGGLLTLVYGLVFNRTTRQTIHDLMAKSYVIKAPPNLAAEMPHIPPIHQKITYSLLGVGLFIGIAGFFFQQNQTLPILEDGEWREIQELHTSLSDGNEFFSVSVNRVNRNSGNSPTILKDLNIEVWSKISCTRDPDYCQETLEQIAYKAFEEYDDIENLSGMRISVVNRFDLGLANGNLVRGISWSIDDWINAMENGFEEDNPWK